MPATSAGVTSDDHDAHYSFQAIESLRLVHRNRIQHRCGRVGGQRTGMRGFFILRGLLRVSVSRVVPAAMTGSSAGGVTVATAGKVLDSPVVAVGCSVVGKTADETSGIGLVASPRSATG